jgi:PAS domain S-box-containing protein
MNPQSAIRNPQSKVLIVDDEKSLRATLAEFLKGAGYDVVCAEDATLAEQLINEQRFDVVVTDIILPRISGVALLQKIRAKDPDALVIMMTGEPTVETAVEAVRAGAYDYLTKPVAKDLIIGAVHRAVHFRQLVEEKKRLEHANRDYQNQLEHMVEERTRSLRESETLYQSLVETLPQHILRKDFQGRFTFANQRLCQILGRSLTEICGKTDFDFYPPVLAAKYQADDRGVMQTGQVLDLVEEYQQPDGQLRFVRAIKSPLYDPSGTVMGVQCIFWDITDQKRAEDQLRQLARAVAQSPVSIVITDCCGNIEFVNPRFTQVTGYAADEVLGKNPRLLKSGETLLEVYQELWETITAGKDWRGEFHNKRKDGSLFWETTTISPIRDDAGGITHFLAVKEDTSEKKLLESKFLRAQRLEGIGSLASGIAHDLNNILTPILICAPILREDLPAKEREQLTLTVETSAARAVDIVKQLLGFGRGTEGLKGLLQIKHLVREMVRMVTETFPRSIRVEQNCPDGLWSVSADPTQIQQVLLNLCVNARDAMPNGGHLKLSATNVMLDESYVSMYPEASVGPHVLIQIADTGTGISDAVRARIFDPFFTTKNADKGTGLGLTTVLGIVKDHHGFIIVKSKAGEGTTFCVYLPAKPDAQTVSDVEHRHAAIPRGSGQLVLVVDDESVIRDVIDRTLRSQGYQVLLASEGIEALQQFTQAQGAVDVVVTDMMMPLMDGLTLCRTLRRLSPATPIILTTGAGFGEDNQDVGLAIEELGLKHLLQKPHTTEELLKLLHEALREVPARTPQEPPQ